MHDVLLDDARVVDLLRPGSDTVVVALEEDDLFSVGIGTGGHDGQGGGVAAVLGEEGPIGAGHGVHQEVCKVDHDGIRESSAIRNGSLAGGGGIHVGIVVAQDIGAVGAHVVDEAVAVQIPEVGALCLGGVQGKGLHGDVAALGGTLVAVDARGDDLDGALKGGAGLFVGIDLSHGTSLLVMPDRWRRDPGCG